jgi:putative RNA 2'-phosphotransferase
MSKTEVSKLLAYVLRHNPADIGIELDVEGWTDVDILLSQLFKLKGVQISRFALEEIVNEDKKGRYTIRENKIRANQGHSLENVMAVALVPVAPPEFLYHGTTRYSWSLIQKSGGLRKMNRHHVHMSGDLKTAHIVANRRKKQSPCVLWIDAQEMYSEGYKFFLSDNGVWLTDHVPLKFVKRYETREDYHV